MKLGLSAALALVAYVGQADAAILQYRLSGTYQDGQTLSGGFTLDTTKPFFPTFTADMTNAPVVGSTLTLSTNGTYGLFAGGVLPNAGSAVKVEFLTNPQAAFGILALTLPATYNPVDRTVSGFQPGAIQSGSIYGLGNPYGARTSLPPYDMVLVSGIISQVPEPVSLALLAGAIAGAVAARRRPSLAPVAARSRRRVAAAIEHDVLKSALALTPPRQPQHNTVVGGRVGVRAGAL